MPECPLCKATAGKYAVILANDYHIYKCTHCGLEYTSPIPSDKILRDFYTTYHDIRANSIVVQNNARRNLKLLEYFGIGKDSYILDFGSGNGEFVEIAGIRCFGIEINLNTNNQRIVSSFEELKQVHFNAITLWGVLEHLSNIVPTMQKIVSHLEINGILALTTVDSESAIPYFYKPPEHLTYWTKRSLEQLAKTLGLKIVFYEPYIMEQLRSVYLDRLLSRTPLHYRNLIIKHSLEYLPEIVEIPTNEIFVVMQK